MVDVLALLFVSGGAAMAAEQDKAIDIGSRRELFVDDYLIAKMDKTELRLHRPATREVAVSFDKPWEGNTCAYVTVFKDDDKFRMYYRGTNYDPKAKKIGTQKVCYAESVD
jgi:hypothetical protein